MYLCAVYVYCAAVLAKKNWNGQKFNNRNYIFFLFFYKSIYRIKKCSKSDLSDTQLSVDAAVDRILAAVDTDKDGEQSVLLSALT